MLHPDVSDLSRWRSQYTLDPDVIYLNHGSFGAVPVPVQEAFRTRQREMETNPVKFMSQTAPEAVAQARRALARFVGTQPQNLGFVTNVTHGVNVFARAVSLSAGDEVLATNQEYGATQKAFLYQCRQAGAHYRIQEVPFPVQDPADWLDAFWRGVTPQTKVIFFSHITSSTALTLPLADICTRARAEGIITVVDGAHAPGHIDLTLDAWDIDFYTGNCHKWLSSPRGCGFIYADPRHHDLIEPLVVSHGWEPDRYSQDPLHDYYTWQGTDDPCAALSVPAAIQYLEELPWTEVRPRLHAMATDFRQELARVTGFEPFCPDACGWWELMFTARLPDGAADRLGHCLWDRYNIIVPVFRTPRFDVMRVSVKEYNSPADFEAVMEALATELR